LCVAIIRVPTADERIACKMDGTAVAGESNSGTSLTATILV
jgi:hypothetical protein